MRGVAGRGHYERRNGAFKVRELGGERLPHTHNNMYKLDDGLKEIPTLMFSVHFCSFLHAQVRSHTYLTSSQEVPNGFSYGLVSGNKQQHQHHHQQQQQQQEFGGPPTTSKGVPVQGKSASIDQLLSEIEHEYCGPGYR